MLDTDRSLEGLSAFPLADGADDRRYWRREGRARVAGVGEPLTLSGATIEAITTEPPAVAPVSAADNAAEARLASSRRCEVTAHLTTEWKQCTADEHRSQSGSSVGSWNDESTSDYIEKSDVAGPDLPRR